MNIEIAAEIANGDIVLFDLPTFPKGVLSLSLINVGSCLNKDFSVKIIDLNFTSPISFIKSFDFTNVKLVGLKVSSQSIHYAEQITGIFRNRGFTGKIVWGGELPTLLPEECAKHADVVVSGLFEPIAEEFINDLKGDRLKRHYTGHNESELSIVPAPRFDLIHDRSGYYQFMGLPLETSRGCTETCSFCMVHIMQKKNYHLRNREHLNKVAAHYKHNFVNIIDYNFGVSKEHVIETSRILKNQGVAGWMAEMCIEELDNEELLKEMSASGCRIIYCGLESIDEQALASVHKMNTNHVEHYERIIRKAQSYGIQIAAGIIIGIEKMNDTTFDNLNRFFTRMGIIYAKLTFLTYNPGAKVQRYMKKKGTFCTEDIAEFDGNHLTYIPNGLDKEAVFTGLERFIRSFYSFKGIVSRSYNTRLSILDRLEFILFNLCYRDTYLLWLDQRIFDSPANFRRVLEQPVRKGMIMWFSEQVLSLCRKLNKR